MLTVSCQAHVIYWYQYLPMPAGIVLVYDITRRDTFEHLEDWIKEVQQYCVGGLERLRMILIGNKLDLEKEREVCGT